MTRVRVPLHVQVADRLREAITSGAYPPGSLLPPRPVLAEAYGVGSQTVRAAVDQLRAEGLVDARSGVGTKVCEPSSPSAMLDLTTRQKGSAVALADGWQSVEAAAVTRATADATTAARLRVDEDEPLFRVDRLWQHTSGTRALHRLLIPFRMAEGTCLAHDPSVPLGQVFTAVAAMWGPMTWTTLLHPRMPRPDETETLRQAGTAPVLETHRITWSASRPLLFEVWITPGDAQLSFTGTVAD